MELKFSLWPAELTALPSAVPLLSERGAFEGERSRGGSCESAPCALGFMWTGMPITKTGVSKPPLLQSKGLREDIWVAETKLEIRVIPLLRLK